MDTANREWVIYDPPKSVSFGHVSRIRDPRRAWLVTQEFLMTLTEFTQDDPTDLSFYGPEVGCDAVVATERVSDARRVFGPETSPSDKYPRWKITQSKIEAAIQFALDDDRYPKQEVGPTNLHVHYRFLWKELEQLPYQMTNSDVRKRICRLGVYLGGRRLFIQPTFIFPAPWHSHFLREFIARIEPVVPFRFRDQYFKRWLPVAGKGKHGRVLKLSKGWRTLVIGAYSAH